MSWIVTLLNTLFKTRNNFKYYVEKVWLNKLMCGVAINHCRFLLPFLEAIWCHKSLSADELGTSPAYVWQIHHVIVTFISSFEKKVLQWAHIGKFFILIKVLDLDLVLFLVPPKVVISRLTTRTLRCAENVSENIPNPQCRTGGESENYHALVSKLTSVVYTLTLKPIH